MLAALFCALAAAQPELNDATIAGFFEDASLVIKGGNNITETALYGTSVARMQLACTGPALKIAVHPMLAPFVPRFTGVEVAPIPSLLQLMQAGQAALTSNNFSCTSKLDNLVRLCNGTAVTFVRPQITNVESILSVFDSQQQREAFAKANNVTFFQVQPAVFADEGMGATISLVEPQFERVMVPVVIAYAVLVKRGFVAHGMWGIVSYVRGVFEGTNFTNNTGVLYGGALTVMGGRAHFSECLFDSNRAPSLDETSDGTAALATFRSGFWGAVLAYGDAQSGALAHTSIDFVGCTFRNNSADEGGAIAMHGASTSISNCTFVGNEAVQGGWDI
jgi:predicted outer membrane repeat protein